MFCSNCGKETGDGVSFCPHCGKPLGEAAKSENGGKRALSSLKGKLGGVASSLASTFVALAVLAAIFMPVSLAIGALPAAVLLLGAAVYAAALHFGMRHYARLVIAAVAVLAQVGFLYQANHNSRAVQAVKNMEARGDGLTYGDFAKYALAGAKWSTEGFPKDGAYRVLLKGKVADARTGKKLAAKVHFTVKDMWSAESRPSAEVSSVYIKTLGEGSDALQAFNALLYSMD